MSWYIKAIKNYANFDGRSRRKEYWMFYLVNFCIVALFYALLMVVAFGLASSDSSSPNTTILSVASIILGLYGLFLFIPNISVTVRRLHDQDKSGAWWFISFVPLIGGLWLLILMCTEGTAGPNQYGEDPKALGE